MNSGCIVLYCGTVPAADAPGCTAAEGILYKPSSLVVPTCTARCLHQRPLLVKGGTTWARNGRWILPDNARLPRNIQGSFTCRKSTTWDKRFYFPSEWSRAEDFFVLKNPTVAGGFELANLGTKGQHATSRPPKPLVVVKMISLHFKGHTELFKHIFLWNYTGYKCNVLMTVSTNCKHNYVSKKN